MTAHGAGPAAPALRWVRDSEPGIRRIGAAGAFRYRHDDGRPVRDAATLQRIRALAVPPAWQRVWISAEPRAHLQATGRDARGRKQYRYHADWQSHRQLSNFDRLRAFGLALPRIRRRVARALAAAERSQAAPTRELVLATLVRLLDATWMRIGNAEYARHNRSYGLSTLHNRHARVQGDELQLCFTGKGGVRHRLRLSDRRVARTVRRCRDLPGQALFQYVDAAGATHGIDSGDVNDWVTDSARLQATAKDFRTWHGSVRALELILAACAPDAAACRLQDVLAQVARGLGNTPAVCRKAYVHPAVLQLADVLVDAGAREALRGQRWVLEPPSHAGLGLAERRLLGLLQRRPRGAGAGPVGSRGRRGPGA